MGCVSSTKRGIQDGESKAMVLQKKLADCTYDNTKKFNFNGKTFEAKVVKVYDGDTITVVFMVFGEYYKYSIRMDGYDSPELKSKDSIEKKWAIIARDFLSNMILNKTVILTCRSFDKYGRILGTVMLDDTNINVIMIKKGYGRIYDGGHKDEWDFSKFVE